MENNSKTKGLKKVVVAIYGKHLDLEFKSELEILFKKLNQYQAEVIIFAPFYDFITEKFNLRIPVKATYRTPSEIKHLANYMLSLGGDGTFLESVAFVEDSCVPVLGINFGRLGFLANISTKDIGNAIDRLFQGEFTIENRSLLQVVADPNPFSKFPFGLNDFTIQKKGMTMISVDTYINDEFLCTYWADGLIVSTPTGSTAYSLSVGGPILSPLLSSFVISPIAPHNLTVRPFVIPDSCTLKLIAKSRSGEVLVSLDSYSQILNLPYIFEIKKASFCIGAINLKGSNFFNTLRNKLLWGADSRN